MLTLLVGSTMLIRSHTRSGAHGERGFFCQRYYLPVTDSLDASDGTKYKLQPPSADELPSKGFDPGEDLFQVRSGRQWH